jgi:hypothetical protein
VKLVCFCRLLKRLFNHCDRDKSGYSESCSPQLLLVADFVAALAVDLWEMRSIGKQISELDNKAFDEKS